MIDPNRFETRISKVVSILFHPLLMPSWAYLSIVFFGDPVQHEQDYLWLLIYGFYINLLTFVFPVAVFLLMLRFGLISALEMPGRHERNVPILITAVFFYMLFHFSRNWEIDPVFGLYMLGATILSLVAMLINYWWKISLHAIGAGGLLGAISTLTYFFNPAYFQLVPLVVIFTGVIAFSRLKLKAHSQSEVYAGLLLGFSVIFSLFAAMVG